MKLPFITKYNGVFYNAGQEIPCETKKVETPVDKPEIEVVKVEKPKKTTKK